MKGISAQAIDSHALGQFGGRLVRIANQEYACRIDFLYFNQIFDLSDDGRCLTASRTTDNQTIILF